MNQLIRVRPILILCWLLSLVGVSGQTAVLRLRNGDRLSGTLISQDTNRVVIATEWQKGLAVPRSQISGMEVTPAPAQAPVVTSAPVPKPPPPASPPPVVVAKTPPPTVKPKAPKRWAADMQFGLDIQESARSRNLFYTRDKFTYGRSLAQERDRFREVIDFTYSYGKTEGIRSTDQMYGSSKTDYDLGKRLFLYNLGGAGYDKIRRIDLQFEEGPGLGYHVFSRTNFVLNAEAGMNFQNQQFSDGREANNLYFRVAEDVVWKVNRKVDFNQRFEFFPQADTFGKYRLRFDSTLRYALLQNLSFNLTVINFYDSEPALGVNPNDLQIRSSIGVRF